MKLSKFDRHKEARKVKLIKNEKPETQKASFLYKQRTEFIHCKSLNPYRISLFLKSASFTSAELTLNQKKKTKSRTCFFYVN